MEVGRMGFEPGGGARHAQLTRDLCRRTASTASAGQLLPAAAAVLCVLLVLSAPRSVGDGEHEKLAEVSLWEARMSHSLCATQAVKLPDCMPKRTSGAHEQASSTHSSKYSPYVVHGKAVPWKTVQQVVKMHPKTVTKKVLARTQAIRQHLDSIEASEVIREEAGGGETEGGRGDR
jgi:hypothetical protein